MKPEKLTESREVRVTNRDDLHKHLEASFAVTHFKTRLEEITIQEEGTLEFSNTRFPYTDTVHDQLVKACVIPLGFEQDLPFDQFNGIFEQRKRDKGKPVTVCVSNGTVVGVVESELYMHGSAKKGVAKTIDVLEAMSFNDDLLKFDKGIVSDFGVKLEFLIPGVEVQPEVGDVIKVGLEISNSETGGPRLKSDLFTLRLVCSNGCTRQTEHASVYYSKFGNQSYSAKINAFVRQLDKAQATAAESARRLYEGIVEQPVLDNDLLALHRTVKRRLAGKLDADEVLGIDPDLRIDIFNRVRDREKLAPPEPTGYLAWDIHNSVTATAQLQKLELRQVLEEIGGNILLSAQQRRHVNGDEPFSMN
ncbi:hypothetical protein [Novipirellula sp.]|uniref:hypothetical protein n=1 Tax=Novipirellula sp. TaxID=2795430 RepID=UPI0035618604